MIDHLTLSVADLAASRAFYAKVLAPLGYRVVREYPEVIAFGDKLRPYVWMKQGTPTTPQHLAFIALDRPSVDAFHRVAVEAGAKDDGGPGLRAHYHPNYYGAFIIDPVNGHPLEAVCHLALGAAAKKPASKKAAGKKAAPKKKAKPAAKAKRR